MKRRNFTTLTFALFIVHFVGLATFLVYLMITDNVSDVFVKDVEVLKGARQAFAMFTIRSQDDGVDISGEDNFKEIINTNYSFLMFYTQRRGQNASMHTNWNTLTKEIAGKGEEYNGIHFGKFDCTIFRPICEDIGISEYPSIMWMKDGKIINYYSGDFSVDSMRNFIKDIIEAPEELSPPDEKKELEQYVIENGLDNLEVDKNSDGVYIFTKSSSISNEEEITPIEVVKDANTTSTVLKSDAVETTGTNISNKTVSIKSSVANPKIMLNETLNIKTVDVQNIDIVTQRNKTNPENAMPVQKLQNISSVQNAIKAIEIIPKEILSKSNVMVPSSDKSTSESDEEVLPSSLPIKKGGIQITESESNESPESSDQSTNESDDGFLGNLPIKIGAMQSSESEESSDKSESDSDEGILGNLPIKIGAMQSSESDSNEPDTSSENSESDEGVQPIQINSNQSSDDDETSEESENAKDIASSSEIEIEKPRRKKMKIVKKHFIVKSGTVDKQKMNESIIVSPEPKSIKINPIPLKTNSKTTSDNKTSNHSVVTEKSEIKFSTPSPVPEVVNITSDFEPSNSSSYESISSGVLSDVNSTSELKQNDSAILTHDDKKFEFLELGAKNFSRNLNPNGMTMILLMAPWCHFCGEIQEDLNILAIKYKNDKNITIGEVNCILEENNDLCQDEMMQAVPTVNVYRNGKMLINDYRGHTLEELEDCLLSHFRDEDIGAFRQREGERKKLRKLEKKKKKEEELEKARNETIASTIL